MKHDPSGMAASAIVLVGIFILALLAFGVPARAKPAYYDEQLLLYRYTEFCASVAKPPAALAEAINQAMAAEPQKWLPIVQWWNRIAEKYKAAGCGDA